MVYYVIHMLINVFRKMWPCIADYNVSVSNKVPPVTLFILFVFIIGCFRRMRSFPANFYKSQLCALCVCNQWLTHPPTTLNEEEITLFLPYPQGYASVEQQTFLWIDPWTLIVLHVCFPKRTSQGACVNTISMRTRPQVYSTVSIWGTFWQ